MGLSVKKPINEHTYMMPITRTTVLLLAFFVLQAADAKQWTLRECIEYALQNNISLQKARLTRQSSLESVKESQAALLPSLGFSTSQNATYRPWPETGSSTVANGYVQSSIDKVYYNGSYGLNANFTVWNGNRNFNTVKLNKLAGQQAELEAEVTASNIQEQIAQLYVQILYSAEAINVSKNSLQTSKKNEERGQEFLRVGKMSKADLAQLTSQRAQDEYSVVEAESNWRNYKRQLKQLLQLTGDEEFDIVVPTATDEMALQPIPAVGTVYEAALASRPEIKNALLGIESSNISLKIARALRLPTVGLNASAVTNTTSMSDTRWREQMKTNFTLGGGITLSVPIFDNRQARTAINKAKIERQNYMLDLQDKQTTLYSTVENYWLQAVNNQNKFRAAQTATLSAEESYKLLSSKFEEKLINVVELMKGRDAVLQARQNELQSKYLAILNINMLNFYRNGQLK